MSFKIGSSSMKLAAATGAIATGDAPLTTTTGGCCERGGGDVGRGATAAGLAVAVAVAAGAAAGRGRTGVCGGAAARAAAGFDLAGCEEKLDAKAELEGAELASAALLVLSSSAAVS